MPETEKKPKYDLEERTLNFSKSIRDFTKVIPKNIPNREYGTQLIRSSASIGANYIEANESLSKKDFSMRIKISRKEAKESIYWLKLIDIDCENLEKMRTSLIQEVTELMKILSAIMRKSV